MLEQNASVNAGIKDIYKSGTNTLPEEQIQIAYGKHLLDIKNQLLSATMANPPSLFEHLIVDLLSSLVIKHKIDIVVQLPIKIYRADNAYFE